MSRIDDMWKEHSEDGLTLREIGANRAMTAERVRQLLVGAGHKTRTRAEARALRREKMLAAAQELTSELRNERLQGKSARDVARTRKLTVESVQTALGER